ncbi:hypothetical protein LTR95_008093 [Oleoguttula sp. CCFEE 5521]
MPRVTIPLPNTGKRQTLSERIDRVLELPDEEQTVIFDQAEQDFKDFEGFRYHAPATQSRQDYHLKIFRSYMAGKCKKNLSSMTEAEIEEMTFPINVADHPAMFKALGTFVIFVWHSTVPRSKLTGSNISYRALAAVRDSMMFWLRYKYKLRGVDLPATATAHNIMTDAIRAVVKRYPDTLSRARAPKPYLGLSELRQLIDYEATNNNSIEYSEQHQAAWCIARLTACRPGSICWSGKNARNPALTWDNFKFSVVDETPGKFQVEIRFTNIHIKKPEDVMATSEDIGDDALFVALVPPSASNLIFSVAHRLLVIALRRGLIQKISTLDDLMATNKRNIMIKTQHLDEPVFYKGKYKGTGVAPPDPMTTYALDEYLKRRCWALGYTTLAIGMVAIRRRAASDLVSRVGTEATRRILGHAPDVFTLERYYMFVGPMLEQSGMLLEEAISDKGFNDVYRKAWAPLATDRLEDEGIKRCRGAALRTMTDRLALADELYLAEQESPEARKKHRKRLRLYAHRALLEEEAKQQQANVTQAEYAARIKDMSNSTFAATVLARASELQAQHVDVSADDTRGPWTEEGEDEEELDEDGLIANDVPQPDLETLDGQGRESRSIVIPADEELDIADVDTVEANESEATASSAVRYKYQAMAFMEALLDDRANTNLPWSEQDKRCPDCQEDSSVTEAQRDKQWDRADHLQKHMDSNFHSGISKFIRLTTTAQENHPLGLFTCTYCELCVTDRQEHYRKSNRDAPELTFETYDELVEHIESSTDETDGRAHDEMKDLAGWYDPMFSFKKKSTRMTNENRADGLRNLARMGVDIVQLPPVASTTPLPGPFPGTIIGAALDSTASNVPSKFSTTVRWQSLDTIPNSQAVPDHLLRYVTTGNVPSTTAVPPRLQSSIKPTQWPTLPPKSKKLQKLSSQARSGSKSAVPGDDDVEMEDADAAGEMGMSHDNPVELSDEHQESEVSDED